MVSYCSSIFILICIIQSVLIAFLLPYYLVPLSKKNNPNRTRANLSSSVFCHGTSRVTRECRFQNLCYHLDKDEYVFVHGHNTRVFNTADTLEHLDLSSVSNHSSKYFRYVNVSALIHYDVADLKVLTGKSILFHRFNPENLMHVIHDDLIPVYHTRRKYFPVASARDEVKLIAMDGRPPGPYVDLYSILSDNIYYKSNFTSPFICFEDVVVGLSKSTTWYQYGFLIPQGPLETRNFPVQEIRYFREDFQSELARMGGRGSIEVDVKATRYIVLFSRTVTRKILNENRLVFQLSVHYKMPVHIISLEKERFVDVISLVSNAYLVIGVHGAHLVTSLFMKEGSFLVELFPFAVPSDNYTPYKTIAKYLGLKYMAWVNPFEKNTVAHPDWSADLGGIVQLTTETQSKIVNTKTVPEHLCCKDPYWLFRIYQDTIVDFEDFFSKVDQLVQR